MKNIFLILILFFATSITFSQTIYIQSGVSNSSIDWQIFQNLKIFNKSLIGHSFFIGVDYLQKKYFNLSCNLGTLRKGGSDVFQYTDEFGNYLFSQTQKATADYISFNTTIDLKYPIKDKFIPFVSLGPRIDFLVSNSIEFKKLKDNNDLYKLNSGINFGLGIKYKISKFLIGLRGDYLMPFANIADYKTVVGQPDKHIKDKTFLINFIFGYQLK